MTITAYSLSVQRAGRTILHPTTVDIRPGERVGLVGASGSGKSTLGHALIDALRAAGTGVAHVPQSPDEALDPLRSMVFHWRETEQALGLAADDARRKDLFDALHIGTGDLRNRPWGWSRGMQQRFVIAMALIGSPDLLVMDEPTSALDPVVAADTMDLLDTYLKTRKTALLLITHDLGLAARRVSRLLVMDAGRIVEDARTARILSTPETAAAKALCAHRNWLELPC
ncbi:peptide/nickel transport system ATP-binding protein/peptide/nickel transport system ATP-binding protein/nickel transport system ATP-binding protein [Yoonia maricola]|uniref:Peptide/nickel transport system ATP-binding protein/peptide/nickel transport system ATP-binding protein/nickel transport system ATP-binding protein n=1 Tax=Yoonia maricola TaxID=420999 RepID=A0A2M8W170_9RHOB|nr:ATP-binding cassette domain-containing protein [Yoonia maricola]PJI84673.1 peptide/nickel transport system ATP-binding protein/peptide/nickel transport system ATP-binding protein/nickel transport system ATP-binding protein [Yoonia maricola]